MIIVKEKLGFLNYIQKMYDTVPYSLLLPHGRAGWNCNMKLYSHFL